MANLTGPGLGLQMVSSAVLGAAAGTGLALVVAMTIVVYRYYAVKRKGKSWSSLDRWPDPPSTTKNRGQNSTGGSTVLNCWRKPQQSFYAVQTGEFNVAKEQHAVQPSAVTESGGGLPHQSRSYPGGGGRPLARTPSVSSQSSLEGASGSSVHRGSSPQIRAFGPDGRHYLDAAHTASSYPPSRGSRSPSPARAASLDARSASPASCCGSGALSGTASPSQSSLVSLATITSSSVSCGSAGVAHRARCLSPLLIPPPRVSGSDTGPTLPTSPLGSLQPDLYPRRDGPLLIDTRRSGPSLGRLHLRLQYDFDRSDLNVHLIEAHDLAGSDQGGFNDPYVKLTLNPEVDTRKRQTSVYRDNPNPFFDEHFKFPVSYEELQDKTLVLQVFDYDRYSRNDVIGSVRVMMDRLELVSSTSSVEIWGEIARERKPPGERQEVLLSLSYLSKAELLTVAMLKARNLFPPQDKECLDPLVKVYLLSGGTKVKKRKTKTQKGTRDPVWNESFSFNVPQSAISSSSIEICVLDSNSGNNTPVGICTVGPGSNLVSGDKADSLGRDHWLLATQSPSKAIAMWHPLH
ncbi:synaptotagmin-5 isoform X1 [Neodiprion pinetum]|uniref:Synaptotagmin-5 isoform X1 n=2 Tax=Neodiprion lecontei TaxID=441921 RepID=A0ABM3GIJ2_NEOLC|nr:synaptotagmin-5 isoform X1 [Neodiprion pinetum]XP_046600091.1 synaptotagmin-5 isoform X1 [Neodiprion lecontei]